MHGTLNNLSNTLSPKASLTGPVKRADTKTIESHLSSLNGDPSLDRLYRLMGELTIDLSDHPTKVARSLQQVFEADLLINPDEHL